MCKILVKITKLPFVVIALVIEIHNCLTLTKIFTFFKLQKLIKVRNFGAVLIQGHDEKIRKAGKRAISQSY